MRLVVDISAHGFGHISQISPIIRELKRREAAFSLIVRTALSPQIVQEFLCEPCAFSPAPPDIGMVMHGPHRVDKKRSIAAYREVHKDFKAAAAEQARQLQGLNGDLLLSDIGYFGLAGADLLGLPSVALCSFHWGEAIKSYIAGEPEMDAITDEIFTAYNTARCFLLAAPRRTISGIENVHHIAPLARYWGRKRNKEIRDRLGVPPHAHIGLVAFGGMKYGYPELYIPRQPDWFWLVPDNWPGILDRNDIIPANSLAMERYIDVMASSNLVLTKTGYGTFTECASHAVPCLFLSRPDWPETLELEGWMKANGYGHPLNEEVMISGEWFQENTDLIESPITPLYPAGHREVADYLLTTRF